MEGEGFKNEEEKNVFSLKSSLAEALVCPSSVSTHLCNLGWFQLAVGLAVASLALPLASRLQRVKEKRKALYL